MHSDGGGRAAHGLSRGYGGSLPGPLRGRPRAPHRRRGGRRAADAGRATCRLGRPATARPAPGPPAGRARGCVVMDDGHQNPVAAEDPVAGGGRRRDPRRRMAVRRRPGVPRRPDARAAEGRPGAGRRGDRCCCRPTSTRPTPALLAPVRAACPVLVARLAPAGAPPPGPQVGFAGVGKPWKVERAAAGGRLRAAATSGPSPTTTPMTRRPLSGLADRAAERRRRPGHHREGLGPPAAAWRERITAWPVRGAVRGRGRAGRDAFHP